MSQHVVLLAHGSPDPRSAAAVRGAAAELTGRTGLAVSPAFLDHDLPGLATAVGEVPAGHDVVVLPMLLSSAFHARVDVPAAVARLTRAVTLLDPVGHPPDVLDEVLHRADGPVVLVAAGTRVDAEREEFAAALAAAASRSGVDARPAFATGPGPDVRAALDAAPDASIALWLLAPGRMSDGVLATAAAHGRDADASTLLSSETMLAHLADRVSGA